MLITDDIDDIYHRGPGELNYRTMIWAVLATLVALLLVICVIFQVSQSLNRFQSKPKHKISVSSIANSVTS